MAKAISIEARLRWPGVKDDYTVFYEGHAIGSIRRSGPGFVWSISVAMALPDWADAVAPNFGDGMKGLADAWARLLRETSPDRLQRAWEFEKAAQARL